ncbi:MAG: hypothetical protein ACOYBY_19540, partial [Dermatophilaceae bacterium]
DGAAAVVLTSRARALAEGSTVLATLRSWGQNAGPHAALRAGLASSMLVGVVTSRQVIGVPTIIGADTEQLIAILAPAIQQVLAPTPDVLPPDGRADA